MISCAFACNLSKKKKKCTRAQNKQPSSIAIMYGNFVYILPTTGRFFNAMLVTGLISWVTAKRKNVGYLFPFQWAVIWGGNCLFDLFYFHCCSDQTSVLFWGINLWCLVSVRCCKLMESKDRREKYWSDIAACVCTEVSELKRQESQRGSERGIKMKNVMWL